MARPELMVKAIAHGEDLAPLLGGDHVLALGPGLGATDWSRALLAACLDTSTPMVVDADGLNLLAEAAGNGEIRRENWILTPHPAEAARLLGSSVADVQSDRVTAAQAIAQRYGADVALKGCGTVVAAPGGGYAICPLGNPGMATAGSGDVLTGIIGAMLSQGLSCHDAALAGVLAHARAGDLAAEDIGEVGMIAADMTARRPAGWAAARL